MSDNSDFTTPKKVRINEYNNIKRVDSGNNPKVNRYHNSYHAQDYKDFKDEYKNERWNDLYNNINGNAARGIPPPTGPQLATDLKNLEQYRRWGGLSKRMRSRRHNHKRTKHTRRNKRKKPARTTKSTKSTKSKKSTTK
jgi:hypothetical protein